jgi:ADP-ribosylglycohydrolase
MASPSDLKQADARLRLGRALEALEGLSTGDGFGERFFVPDADALLASIRGRQLPAPPWRWTDDTEMALSIVQVLAERGEIDQDRLAECFARRMDATRGYGQGAYALLCGLREGGRWQSLASGLFGGKGSFGNGAAMRAAPLGAYFADDLDAAIEHARRSAEVTHAHVEGVAGAIAVAVAAVLCVRSRGHAFDGRAFLRDVAKRTPPGYTRDGILEAATLPDDTGIVAAATALGNGSGVSAPDTVPLALWCVARHPDSFVDAMWTTVAALGDRDTTCAIAGGVLAARVGKDGVPHAWRSAREPLPLAELLGDSWGA